MSLACPACRLAMNSPAEACPRCGFVLRSGRISTQSPPPAPSGGADIEAGPAPPPAVHADGPGSQGTTFAKSGGRPVEIEFIDNAEELPMAPALPLDTGPAPVGPPPVGVDPALAKLPGGTHVAESAPGKRKSSGGRRRVRSARKPGWKVHFEKALDAIDWPAEATPAQQHEHLESALQAINKAILDAPESELAGCRSTRGYIYLSLNDFDRAEDDCSAAFEQDPQDIEALVWRGCARAGRRRWLAAIIDLTEAIERGDERAAEFTHTRERIVGDALEEMRERVRHGSADAELFFERGRIYECLGQTDRALRDFRQTLEASPDHLAARLGVAQALLNMQRLPEALSEVNQVLAEPLQYRRDALKLRACVHQAGGELGRAISDLNDVKALDPDSIPLRIECGEIELQIGDYAGAINDLTVAVKADRRVVKPRRLRAMAYLAAKNYELAIRDFDYLIHKHGEQPDLLVMRGEAHWSREDLSHAERDFKLALEMDELNSRAYLGMAQVLSVQGKREAAHAYCDRALRLDSRLAEAYLLQGKLSFENDQREKSVEYFDRALRLDAGGEISADSHYRRGISHCQLGRFDEGLADLEQAITIRKHHAGSYVWRSSAQAALGMWGEAIGDLRKAIDVNPQNSNAYRKLGDDVSRRAIEHFTKELARNDEDAEAYYQRGMAREFLGEVEGAHADLQRAACLAAGDSKILVAWTNVLANEGQEQEGLSKLTDFLKTNPQQADVRYERAKLFVAADEPGKAIDDLKAAIQIAPRVPEYRVLLADLLFQKRQLEKATDELTRAIQLDESSYRAFALRGRCHLMHGNALPAIHDFSRSLEIYSDQAQTLAARGHAYLKNHQHIQAMADFEAALGKCDSLLDAFTGRAIVMAKRGDPEAATIWLTKAIHRFEDPESWAVLLMNRGRIFFNMSRFSRAIGDYTAVMSFELDTVTETAAVYARGVALFHEGDTAAARQDFERALEVEPRYKPARIAIDWLDGRVRQRPKALLAPKQVIRPTRPRVIAEPLTSLVVDPSWDCPPPFDQWLVRTVDGIEFGPCPKLVVDQWTKEGRVDEETRLLRADWERWRRASTVFPELAEEPTERASVSDVDATAEEESQQRRVGQDDASGLMVESTERGNATQRTPAKRPLGEPQEAASSDRVDYERFESIDLFLPKLVEGEAPRINTGDDSASDAE